MIKICKLTKDSVLLNKSYANVGLDPIIEFVENSHFIFAFNEILNTANNYLINFTIAKSSNMVNDSFTLYRLESDWTEGYGKVNYSPIIVNDVNWYYRNRTDKWISEGGDYDDYSNYVIFDEIENSIANGKMFISIDNFKGSDISNGLLCKWDNNIESDKSLMLYSRNTHTIYYPKLIEIEPQIYNSQRQIILNEMFNVSQLNAVAERNASPQRFRFFAYDTFVEKDYSETTNYNKQYNLPETTYISLIDLSTNDIIIPFNDNIKMNCDGISNYIDIDLNNLSINRYYEIIINVKLGKIERKFDKFIFYLV